MASDKSSLLINEGPSARSLEDSDSSNTLYFEDGVRKIDFILAYEVPADEDESDRSRKEAYRETFLNNIQEKGLQIEASDPKSSGAEGKDKYGTFQSEKKETQTYFIKVHAPFDILCNTAEDMHMKMPTTENDISIKEWYEDNRILKKIAEHDPFVLKNPTTETPKAYFVATFVKDRLTEFINHDKPELFFTSAERSRLVYFILEHTKFGSKELELGVYNLQHEGVFLDAYPLHEGPVLEDNDDPPSNPRQCLQLDWASFGRTFKYQPIPAIKEYFGEKVALYFSWLGFYTMFLIPAAFIGILCFIYGVATAFDYAPINEICGNTTLPDGTDKFYMCPLCDKLCSYYLLKTDGCMYAKITHFFDNQATLFFALFMSLWATLFLEFWKRQQVRLAYEWHTMDFEEEEERPRPEYLATVTKLRKNPVTMKMEPYMPPGQRYSRLTGAFGVVAFFIILVLGAVVSVVIFRAAFYAFLIKSHNTSIRQRSKIIVSVCAACVNLVAINLLKFVYQRIAIKLTEWEKPRTNTDYEDSFTVKMFWFQFVNTYSSIFYIAFFKSELFTGYPGDYNRISAQGFRLDGCSVQGCFLELTVQLIIIMVGQQIIGNVMEILIPYLKTKLRDYLNRKKLGYENKDEPQWVTDLEGEMQTRFSLFWQYLEIVLQYGFVTMFVAAFPLAPLFALLNNIVEIRLDAVNFIYSFRRPVAERAEDIGAWYSILATLTMFSSIVNSCVLAFTSELIPRLVYYYHVSVNTTMDGFTNFSLSYFNVTHFKNDSIPDNATLNVPITQPFCRYPGYHDPVTEKRTIDYWLITSARLAFVIAFQFVIFGLTWAIAYVVPDVPKTLELKIKREVYLAAEAEKDYKENLGKRKPRKSETDGYDNTKV